jgi:hypothetical protein
MASQGHPFHGLGGEGIIVKSANNFPQLGRGYFAHFFLPSKVPRLPAFTRGTENAIAHGMRKFPIAKPQDEEGEFMIQDADKEKQFKEARGDQGG